jgi:hypothetical protein
LTVIASTVEPKPAPEENQEQNDDQYQFHRFVFQNRRSTLDVRNKSRSSV